jgi:predicted nucleic acid-binding protein
VIYVDTSVILAQLFAEDRVPPVELWEDVLVSSRLAVYETWTRVHARQLASSHGEQVRLLFGRIALVELAPPVLARALEPFPSPVRTLDALHLASIDFLRAQSQSVTIATYDERLRNAAGALGVSIYPL